MTFGFSPFQILKTLAQKKRRNVPLVRKLAYHLEKRLMNLNLETFCEILHSLSQLSFKSNVSIKMVIISSVPTHYTTSFLSNEFIPGNSLTVWRTICYYLLLVKKDFTIKWMHVFYSANFYLILIFLCL